MSYYAREKFGVQLKDTVFPNNGDKPKSKYSVFFTGADIPVP